MSTILNFGRDVQGYNAYAPSPAINKISVTLPNLTPASFIVPSNFENWIVVFSNQSGSNLWVDFTGATAAVPAGSSFADTTSELNPSARTVQAGTHISVITNNSTVDVGVMLYAVT